MVETILLLSLLSSIILGFRRFQLIIPIILVSFVWISPGIRVYGITYLNVLLFSFIIFDFLRGRFHIKKNDIDKYVVQLILYILLIAIPFMFLSSGMSLSYQLMSYKSMILYLVLVVIWNTNIKYGDIPRLNTFFLFSILLVCLYGLFSYATATNYYLDITIPLYGDNNTFDVATAAGNAIEEQRGMLKGRITGTTPHTIQYAIMMGITSFYLLGIRKEYKKSVVAFLIILCFINAILTGSRGPLLGIILGFSIFALKGLTFRTKLLVVGLGIFLNFGSDVLISVFSHEGGSSIEGRMIQVYGCWLEISKSLRTILFGLGSGYNFYYLNNYGIHPLSLGFEGRFLAGLVNYGIIGLLFIVIGTWFMEFRVVRKAYKHRKITTDDKYCMYGLILFEIIYSTIDGTAYTLYFFVVYLLLLKISMLRMEEKLSKSKA